MIEPPDSCPDCGSEIPADAPMGLCPVCLVTDAVSDTEKLCETPSAGPVENHEIIRMIGEGGFARVYEARELAPVRRSVALKILRPEISSPRILARFEAERQALALMDHPGIATVYSAGETADGVPWVSMEYVDGIPVTEFCREENLERLERIQIIRDICLAVHHAHLKGVLHRDIKPSNVLATRVDGTVLTKVIDFGIARALDESLTDRTVYTEMYQLVGTPGYMSPEQASFDGNAIDARSDIYSLGVLLYETLAGKPPFPASGSRKESLLELLQKVKENEPPRLSSHRPELRGPIEWVTRKAMAKNPEDRYESAAALAGDLDNILHSRPVGAGSPPPLYFLRLFVKRHRTAVTGAMLGAIALAIGIILASIQYSRAIHLSRDLQQSEISLRESFRNSDFRLATQLHERRRTADSIAYLSRALRTDPEHHASASCLLSILAHESFRKLVTEPLKYPPAITRLQFPVLSPSGRKALAVGVHGDETQRLVSFDFTEKEKQVFPTGFDSPVKFLSAFEEGKSFVISDGHRIEIRRISEPGLAVHSFDCASAITSLHCDAELRTIAWGTEEGHISSLQLSENWTDEPLPEAQSFAIERGEITSIFVSPNDFSIVYGTENGMVGVWDRRTEFQQWNATAHGSAISTIAAAPSGNPVAIGDESGTVNLFRMQNMVAMTAPLTHSGAITTLTFDTASRQLFAGDSSGTGRYWEPETGELTAADAVLENPLFFSGTIPAGKEILIAEKGGNVRLSNPRTGLGEALSGAGGTGAAAFDAAGRFLLVCNELRRSAQLYDLSRSSSAVPGLRHFHPEQLPLRRIETKELALPDRPNSFPLPSPDGTTNPFRQSQGVVSAKLSPDGSRFAVVSGQNFVQLWDTLTRQPLTFRFPFPYPVRTVEFTDNEEILLVVSTDEKRYLWNLPPKAPDLPPWFLTFCEKMGGKRIKGSHSGPIDERSLQALGDALPNSGEGEIAYRYAKWLLATPASRDLAPGIPVATETYVRGLIERSSPDSLREALQLDPDNPDAIAAVKRGGLRR